MKKCKKLLALTMAVLLAFACFALPSFAASSGSQYGLEATIVTDKENYKANEEIHVTVTVKNTNDFKVEDVSIESLLPETLTLKDGSSSTKTVDLEAGETLTLSFTAVKEKEETSATVPESEGTTPTESETVKPSESETDKPTETETVKPSETETAKPSESETIKPTETQQPSTQESTEQPTQAPTTEQPTQTTTAPITTTTAPFTTGEATTLPSTTGTPSTTGGGIIGDLTTTFPKVTTTVDGPTTAQAENPNTGDSMSVKTLVIAIIALLAVIAVVIILMYKYKKQTTKIISLVMCVAVAATAITGVSFFTAKGADDGRKSFTVEKVITVDGEETKVNADVKYDSGKQDLANGYVNEELYTSITDDNHIITLKDGRKYVDNEILLTSNDGVEKSEIETLVKKYQGKIVGYIGIMNDYQVRFDNTYSYEELEKLVEEFQKNPLIEDAMLQGVLEWDDARSISPATNDSKWINDWDTAPSGANWGIEAIEARKAWHYSKYMNDIHVGILDVGFDTNHEDLTFKETPLFNEEDDHGTHVAGIIGATYNNGKGITGISPNKVNLFGAVPDTWSMYEACLVYAIYGAKSKVVNISLGSPLVEFAAYMGNQNAINELDKYADLITKKLNKLINMGCEFIICTSAGNQGKFNPLGNGYTYSKDSSAYYGYKTDNMGWLCGIKGSNGIFSVINDPVVKDRIITVGALGIKENGEYEIAPYSQIGTNVEIMAPGSDIQSTVCNNSYDYMSGTSMAAPHVAGVASMVFSINPDLTGKKVKEILLATGTGNYDNLKMVNANYAVEQAVDSLNTVLYGRVFSDSSSGQPLGNVLVEALDKEAHFIRQTYTDDNGQFSLNLPADTFSIRLTLLGYQDSHLGITLTEGVTTVLKEPIIMKKTESPDPDPTPGIDDKFAGGDGSVENPYQIATAAQLNAVRNHMDSHFVLINDIDLSKYNWEPIGGIVDKNEESQIFRGTLDGKGYKIQNMRMHYDLSESTARYIGLFACVYPPEVYNRELLKIPSIKNLNMENVDINIKTNNANYLELGSVASSISSISNCSSTGSIKIVERNEGYVDVGGITSRSIFATNCTNSIEIKLYNVEAEVGGISAHGDELRNCTNWGDIYCGTSNNRCSIIECGGISESSSKTIQCRNYGNIIVVANSNIYVGGITNVSFGEIKDCINFGEINLNLQDSESGCAILGCGGIFSYQYDEEYDVRRCINYGNIEAYLVGKSKEAWGGIQIRGIGNVAKAISECINYGNLKGRVNSLSNGLSSDIYGIGSTWNDDKDSIYNSYNLGEIISLEKNDNPIHNVSRIGNASLLENNYSLDSTTLNGTIPTENIGPDQKNGGSMTKAEIEKAIQDLGFELPSELPAAS